MKRCTCLFLALVLLFSLALPANAAELQWKELYTLAKADTAASRSHMICVAERNYLFLPAGIPLNAVPLYFSLSAQATVQVSGNLGSAALSSGGTVDLTVLCSPASMYDLSLRAVSGDGEALLKVTLVPTDGIGSLFLVSDDPVNEGRQWVESSPDKSNKATGSMYYCNALGQQVYHGALTQIKGRGNSTWLADKKPYQIKLDKKTDLLETGNEENKAKTWVLLTNHSDSTSLRNNIVYDMSVAVNIEPGIESEPVNLFYDGEYRGTYLLCEKVEIGEGRVDINDLEGDNEDANGETELDELPIQTGKTANGASYVYCEGMSTPSEHSGGYLLEMDTAVRAQAEACYLTTSRGNYVVVKSPEFCSKTEMDYIATYYQEFEDTVYNGGVHPSNGKVLADYADLESLAQCYIINEWTKNPDGYRTSTYMYKEANSDVMTVGPIWDYDLSFGSSWGEFVAPCSKPDGYFTLHCSFANALYYIGDFRQAVHDSYLNDFLPLINGALLAESSASPVLQSIDGYQAELAASARANGIIWGRSESDWLVGISALESYITQRSAWLAEAFGTWNRDSVVQLDNYIDVGENDWFYEVVTKATDYGILNGMDYGIFSPGGQTTRAQAAKVLFAISGEAAPAYSSRFKDVLRSDWFADAVGWAAQKGVVNGLDDGTFRPNTPITRQDMVVLMYRYLGSPAPQHNSLSNYADGAQVSDYAKNAMQWAVENGVIEGYEDSSVRPFNQITRAEMAAIVVRYYESYVMAGE